jgi:hypothetical protein
MLKTKRNKS